MKRILSFLVFLLGLYTSQVLSGEFYGTWGFTNSNGKLITLNIQEKSVEMNAYQVDNNGIIDFNNFLAWILENLESEIIVLSKNAVLFSHKDDKNRIQLKFQPFDTAFTQDFYLYLDGQQLILKAVELTESPTLCKIFKILKDLPGNTAHIEAIFYKIQ